MYVTRPLSLLRRSSELLNLRPNEGPNSGYLVIFDEECETTTCFGLCKDTMVRSLPFPQNKDLFISFSTGEVTYYDRSVFIPVLNQPLSSNRYYVIQCQGKHKGEAYVSSTEDDLGTCLCCTFIKDVKPKPLDPSDTYHQVEIIQKNRNAYTAKSMAEDGYPPLLLRRKYWSLYKHTPRDYSLDEAPGLNTSLRAALPDLDLSSREPVVVGKWYVPFMFVKEDQATLKDQMKMSMYYAITLEQRWELIFGCDSNGRIVDVDVVVDREKAFVGEKEAVCDWGSVEDGVTWYKSAKGESLRLLGLSALVMERIKWEQERVGFLVDRGERRVEVKRTEKFEGIGDIFKFGCYVLVERFVLKRMDGSVLLAHDFKHTTQIRIKWE